jgi:hypothetical protein
LRMLPVDTRSSRRGTPDSRCPSTKSRSFVTTIRSWTSAIRVISRSGVRLPFGSSDVWAQLDQQRDETNGQLRVDQQAHLRH